MTLFNRSASVEIVTNANSIILIEGLRIVFNIEKTEGNQYNTGAIEIYNLGEETRNRIKDLGDVAAGQDFAKTINLFAGYLDDNGEQLLFVGNITNITHNIQKPDVITEIEASDGKSPMDRLKNVSTYTGKTSAKGVLQTLLKSFDIGSNWEQIKASFSDKDYQSGFSFAGLGKDALSKVSGFLGAEWSVQNNEIKLVPFDGDDRTGVILLTTETGLIGSPKRLSGESRKAKAKSTKNKPGWRFESLLFPSINPLGRVAVQSEEIQDLSEFVVFSVVHTGDTHGQPWDSTIEARE